MRLVTAVADRVDWAAVAADMSHRPEAAYLGSLSTAYDVLAAAVGGLKP